MNTGTELFQYTAAFDWESLVPIAFFILYGLSQFLGKKKKGKEEVEEPEMSGEERARQIREEIRRKIEQRKLAKEVEEQPMGYPPRREAYDPTAPDGQQTTPMRPVQAPVARPVERPVARTVERPVAGPQLQPATAAPVRRRAEKAAAVRASLQERLDEQQERLKESRIQVEKARVQASKIEALAVRKRATDKRDLQDAATFRLQVIAGLRDPNNLRKAIVYREILDPPVGLR